MLAPLEVGRLRAALREALLVFDRVAGPDDPPTDDISPTTPRPRVRRQLRSWPTVQDITQRLSDTPPQDLPQSRPTLASDFPDTHAETSTDSTARTA
ncbi:hypothetical protein GCM10009634_48400 [Saccharothrix xinjiangensis]